MFNTHTHTTIDGTGTAHVYTFRVMNGAHRQIAYQCNEPERVTFESMNARIERMFDAKVIDELTARSYRNAGCCAIWSLAAVTGIDPRTIFNRAIYYGFHFTTSTAKTAKSRNRARWTGTKVNMRSLVLMVGDGFTIEQLDVSKCGKTVHQLMHTFADDPRKYVVGVRGHAFAIDGGTLIDHDSFKDKNKRRVESVWRITPRE